MKKGELLAKINYLGECNISYNTKKSPDLLQTRALYN